MPQVSEIIYFVKRHKNAVAVSRQIIVEEPTRLASLFHRLIKIPKQIDFVAELPREANGKLYKRLLRDRYWAKPVQPHEP